MRGYLSYFKSQVIMGLQYKTSAIAGLATQFAWGFIYSFVYFSFYSHANIESISFSELISYVWLGQAFFSLGYLGLKDEEMINSIKTGTVAYELSRPYDLYTWWYIKLLSKRYANVTLRCLPIIIFSLLLPKPYNLSLPISIGAFLLFVITLLLGTFVTTGINMIVQSISFFTMEDKGISSIVYNIGSLLSGFQLPLPLLPTFIIGLAEYLPFRLIGDLPYRIYSGNIMYPYAIKSITLQIIWIILLIIIGKIIMKRALKKVCIQGG